MPTNVNLTIFAFVAELLNMLPQLLRTLTLGKFRFVILNTRPTCIKKFKEFKAEFFVLFKYDDKSPLVNTSGKECLPNSLKFLYRNILKAFLSSSICI